ncbi:hypothetical protein HOL21_02060 [Candidatus Woesearchaeota archaeon]|jgi:hypothetical protein|nr:hypothetical protein [Candidatus Woesearchaeota archaeon]MBT5396976.1 hypothetical protein [Candidatus Woesearchaeota archaeon]MBT6367169.1 hypothetical protein [Candidatus Woesearchaeota archaeon]MBT7762257.1 hypothetical protein [Candidatus Woesearchaeota archaeon]
MATAKKVEWKFPNRNVPLMKIETVTISVIAICIFFISVVQTDNILSGILLSVSFIALYILLTYIIQKVRVMEEKYHINPTHLHVTRKTRFKTMKEKVPLKDVKFHKLDRFFLGGYVISKKAKHLVFFNTRKELEDFDKFLQKNMKKRKR